MREDRSAWTPAMLLLGTLALGALLVGFIPMACCPTCTTFTFQPGGRQIQFSESILDNCDRCRSSGKITLVEKWFGLR